MSQSMTTVQHGFLFPGRIMKQKRKPNEYIMLYMGVDKAHTGLGKAIAYSIINELKKIDLYKDVKKEIEVYVMYVSEEEKLHAIDIVQNLRLNGVVCETNNMEKGLKGQFKEADRLNAKLLVILNNEDLQKGLVNVKDNQTKEETKVDISEIVDYVIGNL